jgi:hypothetical protein
MFQESTTAKGNITAADVMESCQAVAVKSQIVFSFLYLLSCIIETKKSNKQELPSGSGLWQMRKYFLLNHLQLLGRKL